MKSVILIILDGWGVNQETIGSAITSETTPNLSKLAAQFPYGSLQASGPAIGLPWGEPGNSEVGHLTIGAGRILYHPLLRINNAIKDGSFFKNQVLLNVFSGSKPTHLVGLVSKGTVHSSFKHLLSLLELAKKQKKKDVYLHLIVDGKDSPPQSATEVIDDLKKEMGKIGVGKIASIAGRNYAMNRTGNWNKTEAAYRAFALGEGEEFRDPNNFLRDNYARGLKDYDIPPAINPDMPRINNKDHVFFFNFREDSARQLTEAFIIPDFTELKKPPKNLGAINFATLTQYDKSYNTRVAFPSIYITNTLGEIISDSKLKQLRVAESEKYAHVTYFFNGSKETRLPGEDREIIMSLSQNQMQENPSLKTPEIALKIKSALKRESHSFILTNFANADTLGHLGNLEAAKKGVRAADRIIGELSKEILSRGQTLIITGDHGNAEKMLNPISGEKLTEHSSNPVPLYLIGKEWEGRTIRPGKPIGLLSDIAPTILDILGLIRSKEMTGGNLLKNL